MKTLINFIAGLARTKKHPITLIGTFPKRKASVVALVLAKLLVGQKVNAIEFVAEAQTSRVKDLVASLRRHHGWGAICSEKVALETADGRVQWVHQYWLPEDVIIETRTNDTLEWVKKVLDLRRLSHKASVRAKRRAHACNIRVRTLAPTSLGGGK